MRPLPKTAAVQTRSLGEPLPLRSKWAWHLVFTVVRYDCKLVLKSIIQRDLLSKSCRKRVVACHCAMVVAAINFLVIVI